MTAKCLHRPRLCAQENQAYGLTVGKRRGGFDEGLVFLSQGVFLIPSVTGAGERARPGEGG